MTIRHFTKKIYKGNLQRKFTKEIYKGNLLYILPSHTISNKKSKIYSA